MAKLTYNPPAPVAGVVAIAMGGLLGAVMIRDYRRGLVHHKYGSFRRDSQPFGFWFWIATEALVSVAFAGIGAFVLTRSLLKSLGL